MWFKSYSQDSKLLMRSNIFMLFLVVLSLITVQGFQIANAASTEKKLAVSAQPAGATSGHVFSTQPVIHVQDANGAITNTSTASVTVAIASGTGVLSGTLTVSAVAGVVTFTNLVITGSGPHTLTFTSGTLTSATSTSFTVTTASLAGSVSITGTLRFRQVLTADTSALTGNTGTLSYQWKSNGSNVGTNSATYTPVAGDIANTITVLVTSSVESGTITGTASGVIAKAAGAGAPGAPVLDTKTHISITLVANSLNEFRKDGGSWQDSEVFSGLSPSTSYSFTTRIKTSATTEASAESSATSIPTDAALAKSVEVGDLLGGAITAGVPATGRTFNVTTSNISDGAAASIAWYKRLSGGTSTSAPSGISIVPVSTLLTSAMTLNVVVAHLTPTLPGTYYFEVTIDGATSARESLLISAPVITTGNIEVVIDPDADSEYVAPLQGISATAIVVKIKIPAGALGAAGTFTISSPTSSNDTYRTMSITSSVTTFSVPLELVIPFNATGDAVVAYSTNGVTWIKIPLVTSVADVDGTPNEGWKNNLDGTITIYTRHLTSFGYRANQATLVASPASSNMTTGATTTLSATGGSGTGSITYSTTSSSSICTISGATLTAVGVGICSVVAIKAGDVDYVAVDSASISVIINAPSGGGGGGGGGGGSPEPTTTVQTPVVPTTPTISDAEAKALAEAKAQAEAVAKAAEEAAAIAKAKLEAELFAAAQKVAIELAAVEAKAKADALAKEKADAAEAIRYIAAEKAKYANTLKYAIATKTKTVSVNLSKSYQYKIAILAIGKMVKGKLVFRNDETIVLNGSGDGVFKTVDIIKKGYYLRVLVGKTIVKNVLVN